MEVKRLMAIVQESSLYFLHAKCAIRNVSFKGPDDFFEKTMLDYVEKTWEQWLGPLVPDLPDFATVIGELRPRITSLLSSADLGVL